MSNMYNNQSYKSESQKNFFFNCETQFWSYNSGSNEHININNRIYLIFSKNPNKLQQTATVFVTRLIYTTIMNLASFSLLMEIRLNSLKKVRKKHDCLTEDIWRKIKKDKVICTWLEVFFSSRTRFPKIFATWHTIFFCFTINQHYLNRTWKT